MKTVIGNLFKNNPNDYVVHVADRLSKLMSVEASTEISVVVLIDIGLFP